MLNINQSPKIIKPPEHKLPPKEPSFDLLGSFETSAIESATNENGKQMPDILSKQMILNIIYYLNTNIDDTFFQT